MIEIKKGSKLPFVFRFHFHSVFLSAWRAHSLLVILLTALFYSWITSIIPAYFYPGILFFLLAGKERNRV